MAIEIRILTTLGDLEAAQQLRWKTFRATLETDLLREYAVKLPDFELMAASAAS
jgi:hypothetical protein